MIVCECFNGIIYADQAPHVTRKRALNRDYSYVEDTLKNEELPRHVLTQEK